MASERQHQPDNKTPSRQPTSQEIAEGEQHELGVSAEARIGLALLARDLKPSDVLAFQRRIGNRAVQRLVASKSPSPPSPMHLPPTSMNEFCECRGFNPDNERSELEAPIQDRQGALGGEHRVEELTTFDPNLGHDVFTFESTSDVPIQRRVMMPETPALSRWREISGSALRRIVRNLRGRFRRDPEYRMAQNIAADMAQASDEFRYSDNDELASDLIRRASASRLMQASQKQTREATQAFGYPFSGASLYWGPRVNYAARAYWTPQVNDDYSRRPDPALRRRIRESPRHQRYTITGDPPSGVYEFRLTPAGKADPYRAIVSLFEPQSPHRRTLIHCDYLISLVQFRAYAESIGQVAFNQRIQSYGVSKIVLRWDLFADLQDYFKRTSSPSRLMGMGVMQMVRPSSIADLVIGDHVYFWNHTAYDALNKGVGNAWRLENAMLINRRGGTDIFLGHGSGKKTEQQMRAKLAQEFNAVARRAIQLTRQTQSTNPERRRQAFDELRRLFPNVHRRGNNWWIINVRGGQHMLLRTIQPHEVIGLMDPADPTYMNWVRRPIESR